MARPANPLHRLASLSARGRARAALMVRLAAFVTVTGLLTVYIGAQIARVSLEEGWSLTATFDDASGLEPGDQVKIAGTPVGRVDELRIVDGRARVHLTVNASVTVPADSEAAIRWRDAMGRRVVYLIPGTSPAPMRPGAHITRTRSVVDAGALVDQLAPLTRSIDPTQVNQVLVSLSQALDGNADELDRLLVNVEELSSTIAARRATLRQMLADYATVTEIIARRDKQIAAAVDDLVELSGAFADNRRLIDQALVELAAMVRTSDQVLAGNSRELAAVISRLSAFTSGVRRNNGALVEVLGSAAPKLQRIFAAADNGRYVEVAVPCVSLAAPPCPYPTRLPGPRESGGGNGRPGALGTTGSAGGGATTTKSAVPLNSSDALRRLLVGGG
ncbi:phospholipid/cholesterol/gamma-HCH transport system substrate-binding protein [Thermomonospora echinospora]|uniref:Phospholipid/cholesterol/gamma-HCH transport system substrate-binding protein n=1 Tax=Thermomonospora echinospora TaxID=1992 RepID=A0A1H5XBZ5_9ACTN|nr:MCE family protein [Thermomonospora echinospora]SEG08867.1 phospholipid/cholesterol/gamma-HCH transport system substrate-binding protein [Thermomonospora echinospora]